MFFFVCWVFFWFPFFLICLPQKDEMRGQHNVARREQGLDQWQLNNWLVCEGGRGQIFWGADSGWVFGFLVVLGRSAGGGSGGKWVGRIRRIQVEWLKSSWARIFRLAKGQAFSR
jgi:hypothetical protein